MDKKFAYADDTDKSYGIAGMVISLNISEAEDALDHLNLDGDEDGSFCLDPRYTLAPAGGSTAQAWHRMVDRYRLFISLVVSNIMCRHYVHRRLQLENYLIKDMRPLFTEEGHTFCALDDDEIDKIYRSVLSDMVRLYASPRIHDIARRYATALLSRRSLSHSEAFELLQSLL